MKSISNTLRSWKNADTRTDPLVTLYEIEISDTETLRYVQGDPTGKLVAPPDPPGRLPWSPCDPNPSPTPVSKRPPFAHHRRPTPSGTDTFPCPGPAAQRRADS